mgnify:CR=1 FL=1
MLRVPKGVIFKKDGCWLDEEDVCVIEKELEK